MKIFACANIKQVAEKEKWFSSKACRELKGKGIEFGFEIKGSVKTTDKIGHLFGIHLPTDFADNWQRQGECLKENLVKIIEPVLSINPQPLYVVLHGLRIGEKASTMTGFKSRSSVEDYTLAFSRMIKLVKELIGSGVPVAVENVAVTNFAKKYGHWLAQTYLDLRVPTLVSEMNSLKAEAGCKLVLDFEHLGFTANFANRNGHYASLKPDALVLPSIDFFAEIATFEGNIFHISGCHNKHGFQEIKYVSDKRVIASHDEIEDNSYFEKIVDLILRKNDPIVVVEVSEPNSSSCYNCRKAGVEQRSFEVLCNVINDKFKLR